MGEKSVSGISYTSRAVDEGSGASTVGHQRASRRRNLSVASNLHHQRLSHRANKANLVMKGHANNLVDTIHGSIGSPSPGPTGSRITRSASIRGESAPAIELNKVSLQHVRRILHQLLEDAKL